MTPTDFTAVRPIAWDGYPPARVRTTAPRRTGHPDPLRQVEGQVRCSTGFTVVVGRNGLPPNWSEVG